MQSDHLATGRARRQSAQSFHHRCTALYFHLAPVRSSISEIEQDRSADYNSPNEEVGPELLIALLGKGSC